MHNWWIAALEHAGIWTREEAEYVSKEIRLHIHKEDYKSAFDELSAIIDKGKFAKLPLIQKLDLDVADIKSELEKLSIAKKSKV